jgi:molybdenum cofactor cytidylyltransferase
MQPTIGIIVLAAGGSARLGKNKQSLQFRTTTLLRASVETALGCGSENVVVVLGASAGELKSEIDGLPVRVVINGDWQQGIGGSIRVGLSKLIEDPHIDAVVFMLCDQPLVGPETIERLIAAHAAERKPIVASRYNFTFGVPALFGREIFDELMTLEGDAGAKSVIKKHLKEKVAFVDAPEAALDIDTMEQYESLIASE